MLCLSNLGDVLQECSEVLAQEPSQILYSHQETVMCFPAFAVPGFTVKVLLKPHVDTVTYRRHLMPE